MFIRIGKETDSKITKIGKMRVQEVVAKTIILVILNPFEPFRGRHFRKHCAPVWPSKLLANRIAKRRERVRTFPNLALPLLQFSQCHY